MSTRLFSTIIQVANGIGIKFPNSDNFPFKENDKLILTITDDEKIIIEKKYKTGVYRTEAKIRAQKYDRAK